MCPYGRLRILGFFLGWPAGLALVGAGKARTWFDQGQARGQPRKGISPGLFLGENFAACGLQLHFRI